MDKYGYELIFDTARFWVSRLEDRNRQIHENVNGQGVTEFTETVIEDGSFGFFAVWKTKPHSFHGFYVFPFIF